MKNQEQFQKKVWSNGGFEEEKAFRKKENEKTEWKSEGKEEAKKEFCQKFETAAKIGQLLRLEQRTRQTAQTNEQTASRRVTDTLKQRRSTWEKQLDMNDSSCA